MSARGAAQSHFRRESAGFESGNCFASLVSGLSQAVVFLAAFDFAGFLATGAVADPVDRDRPEECCQDGLVANA